MRTSHPGIGDKIRIFLEKEKGGRQRDPWVPLSFYVINGITLLMYEKRDAILVAS